MSYDTAVTPGQGTQDPQAQNQISGTTGEFGTNGGSTPTTPIPATTPIQYPGQFLNNKDLGSSVGNAVGQAIQSNSSGSGGGIGIGSFLGPIASIIGGLFADGGFVGDGKNGFAAGGQVGSDAHKKVALATGYLTGALHQQKYGGDPSKLADAAAEIKQMLMDKVGGGQPQQGFDEGGPVPHETIPDQIYSKMKNRGNADPQGRPEQWNQYLNQKEDRTKGFAGGGDVQASQGDDSMYVQQALLQSLGMGQNQQQSQDQADQSQVTNPTPDLSSNMQNNLNAEINRQPKGYAAGGPPQGMMAPPPDLQGQGAPMQQPPGNTTGSNQGPPPLQPGQEFQGDGSVKGPGGPQSDSIPAKLSNGEFVMSAPATQFIGVDKLNQMNEKGKQGFMQALGQVQQNQQQPPQGGPGGPQMPPGAQQPPQPQAPPQQPPMASGGIARKKGYMDGFAGM